MNLLAKYRLTDGEGAGFALIGGIKLPTGSTHRRDPEGERLETEHQPGTGSWDPILGASASLPLGGTQLTASALYQLSGRGAQRTRLGDRLQGGVALSHRFGQSAHAHHDAHNHHHGDELDEHHEAPHASWDASSNWRANGKGGRRSTARSSRRAAASGPMSRPGCDSTRHRAGAQRRRSRCRCGRTSAHRTQIIATG